MFRFRLTTVPTFGFINSIDKGGPIRVLGLRIISGFREFKMLLRRRQRERDKTIGFNEETKALHVRFKFWYISSQNSAKQQREMTKFGVFWRT